MKFRQEQPEGVRRWFLLLAGLREWHGESPWDKETDELLRRRQDQSALDESTETGS